jgi:DnaJ homolog subfamily A member 2
MDIFDLLRGGGQRGNVKKKTKTILHQMKVTLEDVYKGNTKYLQISRYRICTSCKGTGSNKPDANTKCQGCEGKGMKTVRKQIPMGIIQQTVQCNDCGGEGTQIRDKDKCKECKGQKVIQKSTALEIQIDRGAPDGKRYTFAKESDEFPNVEPGDVVVEIVIESNKKFLRKGADLVYSIDISLIESLTGFSSIITHLDGRKILVRSRPGEILTPGVLKTIRDAGMPFFEANHRFGNLYLAFNIIFPDKLNKDQLELIKKVIPKLNRFLQIKH